MAVRMRRSRREPGHGKSSGITINADRKRRQRQRHSISIMTRADAQQHRWQRWHRGDAAGT